MTKENIIPVKIAKEQQRLSITIGFSAIVIRIKQSSRYYKGVLESGKLDTHWAGYGALHFPLSGERTLRQAMVTLGKKGYAFNLHLVYSEDDPTIPAIIIHIPGSGRYYGGIQIGGKIETKQTLEEAYRFSIVDGNALKTAMATLNKKRYTYDLLLVNAIEE